MACFVLKLQHKNKCNTHPTLRLASCNYWCFSDSASPLILLDMRSRWRGGGDRNGQCSLYGWVLFSGQFVSKTALIICILMLRMFWVFLFACFWGFKSRCACVFRLRTSGTALIRLMKMWLKSKSFTQSSCLPPHPTRVRNLNTMCYFFCMLCVLNEWTSL